MLTETRNKLIRAAAEAVLELDRHLVILLDAYDFYIHRYAGEATRLELEDLEHTVSQLADIPQHIALRLEQWRKGQDTTQSSIGFEVNVLNELSLQMYALASFMIKKGIELDNFDTQRVAGALSAFRDANKALS